MGDDTLRWRPGAESPGDDYRVFRTKRREAAHPRTGQKRTFSIIESPDWVNVIALTPDDQCVLVRQYRHGVAELTLEIPGGMVDPGEEPLEAAVRELREETGFSAERWSDIGVVQPNPALQTNRCFTFLALDARARSAQSFDEGEVIRVETAPLANVRGMIARGEIQHALVVAAFFHLTTFAGGMQRARAPT